MLLSHFFEGHNSRLSVFFEQIVHFHFGLDVVPIGIVGHAVGSNHRGVDGFAGLADLLEYGFVL